MAVFPLSLFLAFPLFPALAHPHFLAASSQYFTLCSWPNFCSSSSRVIFCLLLAALLLLLLNLGLPSPSPHLQTTTHFASSSSYPPLSHLLLHYVHTIHLSVTFFFTPSNLLLSSHLFFHFFSPVCCDHSQAGDSWNSRQSERGHSLRSEGKRGCIEGKRGDAEMKRQSQGSRVGGGGFFLCLRRFDLYRCRNRDGFYGACRARGPTALHPTGLDLICDNAPSPHCHASPWL